MPFQPVPDAAQVIIRAESLSQECLTILNFRNPSGSSSAIALLNLATTVGTTWATEALPLFTPSYVATKVEATALNTEVDDTAQYIFPDGAGTRSGDLPMPNSVSLAIQHKTGMSGRWARGRTFWPQWSENDISGNEVSLIRVGIVLGVFEQLRTDCIAQGWYHCVVSRWYEKERRAEGVTYDVTTYGVADFIIDSMRRRLPKRGR